jgi:hypothetical protein
VAVVAAAVPAVAAVVVIAVALAPRPLDGDGALGDAVVVAAVDGVPERDARERVLEAVVADLDVPGDGLVLAPALEVDQRGVEIVRGADLDRPCAAVDRRDEAVNGLGLRVRLLG